MIATFDRRQTPFPRKLPLALTEEFALDKAKQNQWNSFLRTASLEASADLEEITDCLAVFFGPLIEAVRENRKFNGMWDVKEWM